MPTCAAASVDTSNTTMMVSRYLANAPPLLQAGSAVESPPACGMSSTCGTAKLQQKWPFRGVWGVRGQKHLELGGMGDIISD